VPPAPPALPAPAPFDAPDPLELEAPAKAVSVVSRSEPSDEVQPEINSSNVPARPAFATEFTRYLHATDRHRTALKNPLVRI
jgi:hypothetical protein